MTSGRFRWHNLAWAVWLAAVLTSCGRTHRVSLLPQSGGRPYEVLLVGDSVDGVKGALKADVEGLPQSEPSFDVSAIPASRYGQAVWLARAIVIVKTDRNLYTATRIRYEKDVHASPQMVVYVNSPSASALRRDMPRLGGKLRELLTRFEINAEMENLSLRGNPKSARLVEETMGWSVKVPVDMASHKRGRNFVWLSNNAPAGMQNLCVYALPLHPLSLSWLIAARDSVMKCNIPGERDGMYVQTVAPTVEAKAVTESGKRRVIMRGLWEMKGDAMGGPFVAHVLADSANGRYVVAEAFVYAPESTKRNRIRQTEAALYTLKKP